ncbi:MAG: hypothetical protein H8F28_21570 [Fibrella sp.]|nr:hypothetical protein [Armatimonadota bacterium]
MTRTIVTLAAALAVLTIATTAHADFAVIPATFTNTEGSEGTVTITNSQARTYQYLIEHSLLAAVPDNSLISGISFRLNGVETGESKTFADYEIYFGVAATTDFTISSTFANNIVGGNAGRTLVRDGGLSFDSTYFPSGNTPNAFATPFAFNTSPYLYDKNAGNGLIIEIRHTGGGGVNQSLDSEPAGNIAGASNIIATSFDATEVNTTGSFIIPQLQFTVVPEANTGLLATLILPAVGFLVARRRKG